MTRRNHQPAGPVQAHEGPQAHPMNRWLAILYVIFCFEMGVFLFLLPWVSLWGKNFFVGHYPWVSAIAGNYFVRGGVSGLGLADIVLAFSEIWRLRRTIGLVQPRSAR